MIITLPTTLLAQFGVSFYVFARPGRRLVFISRTECYKLCRFYVPTYVVIVCTCRRFLLATLASKRRKAFERNKILPLKIFIFNYKCDSIG